MPGNCQRFVCEVFKRRVLLCRRYSYSAVGLNYLTSAVVMLEAIVLVGLVQQVIFGTGYATPFMHAYYMSLCHVQIACALHLQQATAIKPYRE